FFFIGVILALWAVTAMAVVPVVKGIRHVVNSPRLYRHRARAIGVSLGAAAAIGAFLFLVPIPSHTQAEGVVWLSDQALVRAGENGFLTEILATPGSKVHKGDPLLASTNMTLQTELRISEAKIAELQATLANEQILDRTRA